MESTTYRPVHRPIQRALPGDRMAARHFAGEDRFKAEKALEINVVLAYENISAALNATEALTQMFGPQAEGMLPCLSAWNFSRLKNLEYFNGATLAAAHADLIIISTARSSDLLPKRVETWLNQCPFEESLVSDEVARLMDRADLDQPARFPNLLNLRPLGGHANCYFFAPLRT